MSAVREPDVSNASTVVEVPELRVMVEPTARVEPEIRYWDWGFGMMVEVPMVRAGSVPVPMAEGKKEVRGP